MAVPKDPVMLMSYVNTQLRDQYASLSDFAASAMLDENEILEKLDAAGYVYNKELNRFVAK